MVGKSPTDKLSGKEYKMDYLEKTSLLQNKKTLNIILISIVGAITIAGIFLAAYSIMIKNYLYAILYIISVILGLSYVVIKINTITPSYIAIDNETVYMQCWENGIFSYNIHFKPSFFADFIPAKVIMKEIPINKITKLYVGSRNYLSRNLENTSFTTQILKLETIRHSEAEAIRKMDFICVLDDKNNISFMPISDMNTDTLARIVNHVHRKNENADIKCNLRELRSKLTI